MSAAECEECGAARELVAVTTAGVPQARRICVACVRDAVSGNRIIGTQCHHVRAGDLPAIERVTLTTIEPVDDDFRYRKGPDHMEICACCAGMLLSRLLELGARQ